MSRSIGKITYLGLSLLLALSLLVAGCGQSKPAEKKDSAAGGQKVIKFGVPTPLSAPGDYKAGEINSNTLKMAQEQINNAGGINGAKIELVIGDDQGNTSKGVSLVQKMITEDKVSAILGPWHGSVALAQAKVADEKKVPILIHYSWPDEITSMHSDYIFRVSPFNSEIADLLVPFVKGQNYKNIAIMAEDSSYGTGFGNAMKKAVEKEGIKATLVVFPSNSMDLTPQLMDLKRANPQPELLVVASVYQPMYLIPKQAKEVGLNAQVMAGWDYPSWSQDFWKTVGDAGKGILYPAFYSPKITLSPMGEKFKTDYK
ncbi:MAG: ABC transporter substrate-binding protein, partial [Desulfocucumaceae bacterium]